MDTTSYKATTMCLIDETDSVTFWFPRGLKYAACRAMAELQKKALGLYDIDVIYKPKRKVDVNCEESSKHRIYPDITRALIDNHGKIQVIFRRGELFKKAMMLAESMGFIVEMIQVEVTEELIGLSLKDNGDFKFFEDFRDDTLRKG